MRDVDSTAYDGIVFLVIGSDGEECLFAKPSEIIARFREGKVHREAPVIHIARVAPSFIPSGIVFRGASVTRNNPVVGLYGHIPSLHEPCGHGNHLSVRHRGHQCLCGVVVERDGYVHTNGQVRVLHLPLVVVLSRSKDASVKRHGSLAVGNGTDFAKTDIPIGIACLFGGVRKQTILCNVRVLVLSGLALRSKHQVGGFVCFAQSCIDGVRAVAAF